MKRTTMWAVIATVWVALALPARAALVATTGGTMKGPLLSTSTSTNAPSTNEFVTAWWVAHSGAGSGNMVNSGTAIVGAFPVATDITGQNWTPTNIVKSAAGVSVMTTNSDGGNYLLSSRVNMPAGYTVASFEPLDVNEQLAIDLFPYRTTFVAEGNNNGHTWIDLCDRNIRLSGTTYTATRVGCRDAYAEFGSRSSPSAGKPIGFTIDTDLKFAVSNDCAVSFGGMRVSGDTWITNLSAGVVSVDADHKLISAVPTATSHMVPLSGRASMNIANDTDIYGTFAGSIALSTALSSWTNEVFTSSGLLTNLYFAVVSPLAAGTNVTVTIMTNGVDSNLTVTLHGDGTETKASLTGASCPIAFGDKLTIHVKSNYNATHATKLYFWSTGLIMQ